MNHSVKIFSWLSIFALVAAITAQETTKFKATKTDNVEVGSSKVVAPVLPRRELTLRQRRELGLTFENVKASYNSLKQAGEIDDETSSASVSVAVLSDIRSKNAERFASARDLNWETILEWIERILDLIKLLNF